MKEYQALNQKPIIVLRILTEIGQSIFYWHSQLLRSSDEKTIYTYAMQLETRWKFEDWKCFWISATPAVIQVQSLLLPALGHFM